MSLQLNSVNLKLRYNMDVIAIVLVRKFGVLKMAKVEEKYNVDHVWRTMRMGL